MSSTSFCRSWTTAAWATATRSTRSIPNAIVVMTSTSAARSSRKSPAKKAANEEQIREAARNAPHRCGVPANRIDEVLIFHPLKPEAIHKIVGLQVEGG